MLTYDEAERFYDSFGIKQDRQIYEESAINALLEHGEFAKAKNVVEFGCGTGRLASLLLTGFLPGDCYYFGIDISQTMIDICRDKIKLFSERAKCFKSEGPVKIDLPDQSADHFVSTYVLDLLSENDILVLQDNAYRILSSGGFLCLVSLSHGLSIFSHIVESVWVALFKLKPAIVGGCRPVDIVATLQNGKWEIIYVATIVSFGVPSEVVIARKI